MSSVGYILTSGVDRWWADPHGSWTYDRPDRVEFMASVVLEAYDERCAVCTTRRWTAGQGVTDISGTTLLV